MNLTTLRAQLYAMQAQIQAVIVEVEIALEIARTAAPAAAPAPPESTACTHAEEQRRPMGTFTAPSRFFCLACRTEVDPG